MRPNLGQLSSHSDSKRSTTISTRLPSQNNNRRRRMPENDGNCRNDARHRECGLTWQLNRRQCPISELRTVPITNPDSLLVLVGEDDESHSRDDAIMRQGLTKRCEMRQTMKAQWATLFFCLLCVSLISWCNSLHVKDYDEDDHCQADFILILGI